jgi:hypothetical protein
LVVIFVLDVERAPLDRLGLVLLSFLRCRVLPVAFFFVVVHSPLSHLRNLLLGRLRHQQLILELVPVVLPFALACRCKRLSLGVLGFFLVPNVILCRDERPIVDRGVNRVTARGKRPPLVLKVELVKVAFLHPPIPSVLLHQVTCLLVLHHRPNLHVGTVTSK